MSKADCLALRARLASFGLTLDDGKTRLNEFGRFAALSQHRRHARERPETFAFLGFTHYLWADPGRPVLREAQNGRETPYGAS
ncbi:hypothetical protein NKI38_33050 [Mesorhizobium sp. M0621]|uniref:hypothetical protein n=1 Tax=Mesorhizobium sp. M0621 TaxID=2956974 RepID=UPI00333D129C